MKLRYLLRILVLWLPIQACYAEVTEYDIEIVIFEDLSNRYIDKEQWPRLEITQSLEQPDMLTGTKTDESKTAEIPSPDSDDVINISSNEINMLNKYVKILTKSARYNVLVHKSWRQTGLDAKSAINVHINSEDTAAIKDRGLTGFNSEKADTQGSTGKTEASSSISGDVKVILGRYLHIYTDLIYKRSSITGTPVLASSRDDQFKEFSVKSHRRMRSKELHFIDHPLVGILVMAIPVEKTEEEMLDNTTHSSTILSE